MKFASHNLKKVVLEKSNVSIEKNVSFFLDDLFLYDSRCSVSFYRWILFTLLVNLTQH